MPASSKAKKPNSPKACPPSLLAYENAAFDSGVFRVAGVDEAGRGPLAGPVVAAAVMFPREILRDLPAGLQEVNDSKQLTEARRNRLFDVIAEVEGLRFGIAACDADEIDRLNILRATHKAMATALSQIQPLPELALVDGLAVPGLPCSSQNIVKGDTLSFSIAAASILAKVTRDRIMQQMDRLFPEYGFAQHKGYGTRAHLAALAAHGPCPLHRRSFAPVAACTDLFSYWKQTGK
jgi:ribonuclease HII